MSGAVAWRDMASAPKDATEIILRIPSQGWPDHYAQIAHWAEDLSGEEQPPFRGWFRKTGYGCEELADPTGWRPLFGDARPVEPGEVERLTRENNRLTDAAVDAEAALAESEQNAQGLASDLAGTQAELAETRERLGRANAERSQLLADLQLLRTEMATAVTDMQDRAEVAEAKNERLLRERNSAETNENRETQERLIANGILNRCYLAMRDAMKLIDPNDGPGHKHSDALNALAQVRVEIERHNAARAALTGDAQEAGK